ncbi:probable dihydroxyacetone kinase regulator [Slackia heliotrinireducens]|uniref:Transcriptional regulator TetR C-terminal Firmicutes type domain-containing protein n=1 Tax=Slackia heliotrinireducens (strain ATCC 29202 / DSM 20476 / NCTC 11029 / RHS 1) TaxID=471855 RepID=C7N3C1_SLAHD|nr:TetR-like C-terminal domain-containing protein [Slackia heliotrinireducens]ACV23644.1 hypothetical protein Shel_26420 [Slackia heliotrinireducens DSM 20476]VEH03156.1 probable dihydroxyacetone kinase regulator [Slackia heliotrinireducens]
MPIREPKSRMRVVRALESMMESTPIEKVQVTRLCELADIGRTTFYDNFENVFAVVNWYWDQTVQETLYRIGNDVSFYDAHLALFKRLRTERAFFVKAFRNSDYSSLNQHGYRHIGGFYLGKVKELLGRALTPEEESAIHFFNVGASDYCAEWVRSGMNEEPEILARTFTNAAPPVMDCLQNPKQRID